MLQEAEVGGTVQLSEAQQVDPTSDDISVPELMQMVGEQAVDLRVRARVIRELKTRLATVSKELLIDRSKGAQLKAGLEDALKTIESLKRRISQLEDNVHDVALARDDLKRKNEALEGEIKGVRPFSRSQEEEECQTPSNSDEA
jgi:chromosome segregation ATPase